MQHWFEQQCQHYAKGQGILSNDELQTYLKELGNDWKKATIKNKHVLQKTFQFERYQDVLAFVACVGEIAENHNHHPDMLVKWGECTITFCTHSAGGITLNDLICARFINKIAKNH